MLVFYFGLWQLAVLRAAPRHRGGARAYSRPRPSQWCLGPAAASFTASTVAKRARDDVPETGCRRDPRKAFSEAFVRGDLASAGATSPAGGRFSTRAGLCGAGVAAPAVFRCY